MPSIRPYTKSAPVYDSQVTNSIGFWAAPLDPQGNSKSVIEAEDIAGCDALTEVFRKKSALCLRCFFCDSEPVLTQLTFFVVRGHLRDGDEVKREVWKRDHNRRREDVEMLMTPQGEKRIDEKESS